VSAPTLLAVLHDQVCQLRDGHTTTPQLRVWAAAHPALERFGDIAALEAAVHDRTTAHDDVDAVYTALLTVHHAGDSLAGRIVLGLLLPAIAHRYRRRRTDRDDWLSQLVTELWHAICHYPLHRRPRAIPANLIRDAAQRTQRALAWPATAALPETVAEPTAAAAFDRACDRIDLQRAVRDSNLSTDDLRLLTATRVAGIHVADLATGTDAARLRQRRHRAERRLRNHLAA
jgi:hypothetical protein